MGKGVKCKLSRKDERMKQLVAPGIATRNPGIATSNKGQAAQKRIAVMVDIRACHGD